MSVQALVVDDNWDVGLLLGRILQHQGVDARTVSGGAQALESLAAVPLPDIVLLDVQMPDMDGWQTLQAIRDDPRTSELPVIICSVKASAVDLVKAWDFGCDGYVAKPFEMSDLLAEVWNVLARSRAERDAIRAKRLAETRLVLREQTATR